ncbi:unnamed protein product [Phyllotreta striolata]|uniref:Uncharacterized protein n=1 Tax=Phyllotreta striolata TaxID=444603 RepID=A0A9N9TFA4_PHYSR|nr:unnamed protein product [Phyllotreta striolata]
MLGKYLFTILMGLVLLNAVVSSDSDSKIWTPDEFEALLKRIGELKTRNSHPAPETTTEFEINMRNIFKVDCFEGYKLVHGRCRRVHRNKSL